MQVTVALKARWKDFKLNRSIFKSWLLNFVSSNMLGKLFDLLLAISSSTIMNVFIAVFTVPEKIIDAQ